MQELSAPKTSRQQRRRQTNSELLGFPSDNSVPEFLRLFGKPFPEALGKAAKYGELERILTGTR